MRPATSYTNGVKLMLMRRQHIDESRASEFELDHRIPLFVGGHPRKLSNLQLQPWDGPDDAKVKDRLEARLQKAVCRCAMSLAEAHSPASPRTGP